MAHKMGIQAPSLTQPDRYGLSLVLGGGEVRPLDMAAVYATFANQGKTVIPKSITSVSDRFGSDITKPQAPSGTQALDPRIAYMVTNILSDNESRKEIFGENSPLKLGRPAAVKTGTTNDYRDNWAVGYTPELVTAVWVGNNDHSPMRNVDGVTGAAPIWHDFMEFALAGTPPSDFALPAGLVTARVCNTDGGLVDPKDPRGVTEVFLAEAQQTRRCGWAGGNTRPRPATDDKDEQKKDREERKEDKKNPEPDIEPGPGRGTSGGNPGKEPELPPEPVVPDPEPVFPF